MSVSIPRQLWFYRPAVLVIASTAALALLGVRFVITDAISYRFLAWNLFLAWIPFMLSSALDRVAVCSTAGTRIAIWLIGGAWLLFFPNAPYILTDVVHLTSFDPARGAPGTLQFWFDIVLVGSFALTGLVVGFASLHRMQRIVERSYGTVVSWGFVAVAMVLAGIGIYLGRVERFNSWDIFTAPAAVIGAVAAWLRHPRMGAGVSAVTLSLAAFLLVAYVSTLTRFSVPGRGAHHR